MNAATEMDKKENARIGRIRRKYGEWALVTGSTTGRTRSTKGDIHE